MKSNLAGSSDLDQDQGLLDLKKQMTPQQQQDMAEIIGNELKRRESLKTSVASNVSVKSRVPSSGLSNALDSADLGDMYASADRQIQEARVKALESKLKAARKETKRIGQVAPRTPSTRLLEQSISIPSGTKLKGALPAFLLGIALISVLGVKLNKEFGLTTTLNETKSQRASLKEAAVPAAMSADSKALQVEVSSRISASSELEKSLLMQLDSRRVELERRREILDQKEIELRKQAKLVTAKVTELKSLINKLTVMRKEKDTKYNARLEQLASVYSAMGPKEASGLIGQLDDDVALALLERLSGKRMAQILGTMEQKRALELTKLLTSKKKM